MKKENGQRRVFKIPANLSEELEKEARSSMMSLSNLIRTLVFSKNPSGTIIRPGGGETVSKSVWMNYEELDLLKQLAASSNRKQNNYVIYRLMTVQLDCDIGEYPVKAGNSEKPVQEEQPEEKKPETFDLNKMNLSGL